MAPRIAGNPTIRRLKPRERTTAEASQIIVPFTGLYLALKAAKPAINSPLPGFPADHLVKEVSLEEGRSVEGRMVVTLEKSTPDNTGSTDSTPLGEPIYELDWGEARRPLEEHLKAPRLNANRPAYEFPDRENSASNTGWPPWNPPAGKTGRQRSWDDWAAMDGGDVTGGTWDIDEYKALKSKGYDTFPVAFPIARVTIYAKYRISSAGGVWQVSSPPAQCGAPGGWTYVKTAARSSKQGRLYTFIQEWRGFNKVEAQLLM